MHHNKPVSFPDYFCIFLLASDQLADLPPNDIGFDHTRPHSDPCNEFFFTSGISLPPSQYIDFDVEPEEEGLYSGEGDTTIRASEGTDILRMLNLNLSIGTHQFIMA